MTDTNAVDHDQPGEFDLPVPLPPPGHSQLAWRHRDHTITLGSYLKMFEVTGPEYPGSQHTSFEAAKGAIDAHILKLAKKARTPFEIKMLAATGEVATITGIHMGTGELLGDVPKSRGTYGSALEVVLYPDLPWVREAVKTEQRLRAELLAVSDKLKKIALSYRAAGRPSDYATAVEALKGTVAIRQQLAEKLANE